MKKIIASVFILGLLVFASCSKENESNITTKQDPFTFAAYKVTGGDLLTVGDLLYFSETTVQRNESVFDLSRQGIARQTLLTDMVECGSFTYAFTPGSSEIIITSCSGKSAALTKI